MRLGGGCRCPSAAGAAGSDPPVIPGLLPLSGASAAGVAAAVSALAVVLLLRWAHRLPGDAPNARSLHAQPVPRAGGIAIWAGYLPAMWAGGYLPPAGIAGWVALGAVAAVSAAGKSGKVLVAGFDNIAAVKPMLADGRITATADQHGDLLAVYGIEAALKILRGEASPSDQQTAVDLITP